MTVESVGETEGPIVLGREERRHLFGLDCAEKIEWRNWQAGGEYTRSIVLKNVTTQTIRIKYKLPVTKYFSMEFPTPIKLCAGMSFAVKVTFRPIKQEQYQDFIEFECPNGSFLVPVIALTPQTRIEVDDCVDFGFVPAMESKAQPLMLRNVGDVAVSVHWKVNDPFSIQPPAAFVTPGDEEKFEATFCPTDASVFMATAVCELDNGEKHVVKIAGIGKYPHLTLEPSQIDFGDVLIGQTVEKEATLSNFAVVDARFDLKHELENDGVFAIAVAKKSLAPNESTPVRITFTPKTSGMFSLEAFGFSTRCGRQASLTVEGSGVGSVVHLSAKEMGFGDLRSGKTNSRVLYIENASSQHVPFQFATDPLGVFSFDRTRGVIPPNSVVHVTITFRPVEASNYWKRVVCLIKDSTPLSVDLYGTCFNDKTRPPTLDYRHVLWHLADNDTGNKRTFRAPSGVSTSIPPARTVHETEMEASIDPVHKESSVRELVLQNLDRNVPGCRGPKPGFDAGVVDRGPQEAASALNTGEVMVWDAPKREQEWGEVEQLDTSVTDPWDDFFNHEHKMAGISVDVSELDFGSCSRAASGEYKTLVVRNLQKEKLTVFFSIPPWEDPSGAEEPRQIFEAFPSHMDIKGGAEAAFRIAFRPTQDAQYYHSIIDVVAFVKSMRNFRLASDDNIVPPWNVSLQVTGNTFLHRTEDISPKIQVSKDHLVFPPTRVGEAVHQTLMIVNYSDTPVAFALKGGPLGPHFEAKPMKGVVPQHSQQLVGFRFVPTDAQTFQSKVMCVFNNAAMNATDILVKGVAYAPRLGLSVGGSLFFKPTCVGASSQRTIHMTNSTRVPVSFNWIIPDKLRPILFADPESGNLQGKESRAVVWTFSPDKRRTFQGRVQCIVADPLAKHNLHMTGIFNKMLSTDITQDPGPPPSGNHSQRLSLTVIGEGSEMALKLDPSDIDLGTLVVGFPVRRSLCLMNQSDGVLRYKLRCTDNDQALEVLRMSEDEMAKSPVYFGCNAGDMEVAIDQPEGTVPARAFKNIQAVFRPLIRRQFDIRLMCETSTVSSLARSLSHKQSQRMPTLNGQDNVPAEDSQSYMDITELACTRVSVFATFPAIKVTDLFCCGWPKPYLWEMMNANEINLEAESVVSEVERRMEKLEIEGKVTNQEVVQALRPIRLDFGLAAIGSEPIVVSFEIMDPGDIPVVWELHSNDQPEIELERWVEPGRPRNDEEKLRDFIVDNKIFQIEPRSGDLMPGDRVRVTMMYSPVAEGEHSLPILMRVRNGKRIRLELVGKTVPEETMHMALVPSTQTFTLQAVPIGHTHPPFQMYELRNGGPSPLRYKLDLSPLDKLRDENFEFNILEFKGRQKGEVPSGSVEPWLFRFNPLEAKVYEIEFAVCLDNGSTDTIKIIGRGYHPDTPRLPEPLSGENDREGDFAYHDLEGFRTVMSDSLVSVSREVLSLGNIPLKGISRRLVEVTCQCHHSVEFVWDLKVFDRSVGAVAGRMQIDPPHGMIAPGETLVCRMDYEAGLETEIFEGDIGLHVRPAEEWEASDDDRAISEEELTGEEVIAVHPQRGPEFHKGTVIQSRLPIHLSSTQSIRNRLTPLQEQHYHTMRRISDATNQATPPLPDAECIVLTVRGCVAPQEEMKRCREAWIPHRAGPLFPPESNGSGENDANVVPPEVRSIVQGIVSELVCDEDVQDSFTLLEYETTPTFNNLGTRDDSAPVGNEPWQADTSGTGRTDESLGKEHPPTLSQDCGNGVQNAKPAAKQCSSECGLDDPAFQNFAEFVVRSTVMGLMQESASGDWE